MPMKPHKGESQSDFMSRCVPDLMGDGKRENDQAVAACMNIWRNKDKAFSDIEAPFPDEDEDHQEFIDRCVTEVLDNDEFATDSLAEEVCELNWEQRRGKAPKTRAKDAVVQKTHAEIVQGMEFILSDETPDRLGDVIMANGWDLTNFKKNPVALWAHRHDAPPIGRWKDLRVEKGLLRGHLEMAPAGTSARIDEIRKLIDAGILRAVSVGFRPLETKPRKSLDGMFAGEIYVRQELVETSLVSVPANPNSLAIAKSLGISADTRELVFAKHGNRTREHKRGGGNTGKHAETSRTEKGRAMSLAQRIEDGQGRIVALRDQLTEHLKTVDDSNVSDAQLTVTTEINGKIAQEEKGLAALRDAERHLAASSSDDNNGNGTGRDVSTRVRANGNARPFNLPAKKTDPLEYLVRAGTVQLISHRLKIDPEKARQLIASEYPGYGDEPTKAVCDWVVRAATAPAMTTVTGWAAELVQQINADFMETLMPKSVFPRLRGLGLSLSFGRNGRIAIPTRSRTPTIAGSFVGEGMPIPVRQGAFTSVVLTPKKMAVITTWTREISEHSVPAIEGLLRNAIQEDTAVSLDAVLLDSNAATSVRPAGLLNGVAALTATAGGGFTALVGDIKQLTGALMTGTAGNIRSMAFLMNPQQVLSASLTPAPNAGIFPFEEVGRGTLRGYPIIDSGTVPLGTVIVVDAADFVTVGGEAPRFEISDQATLHEEDSVPLPIHAGSAPGVAANPVRSLWQTDSLALRLILPMNWTLRRTGVVAWTQNVTW